MSSLAPGERAVLEKLLGMSAGYVSDFSDATFGEFFGHHLDIDIHGEPYTGKGLSKAKKLREFWRSNTSPVCNTGSEKDLKIPRIPTCAGASGAVCAGHG